MTKESSKPPVSLVPTQSSEEKSASSEQPSQPPTTPPVQAVNPEVMPNVQPMSREEFQKLSGLLSNEAKLQMNAMMRDYQGILDSTLLAFRQGVTKEQVIASFIDTVQGVYDLAGASGPDRARGILLSGYQRTILPIFVKAEGH